MASAYKLFYLACRGQRRSKAVWPRDKQYRARAGKCPCTGSSDPKTANRHSKRCKKRETGQGQRGRGRTAPARWRQQLLSAERAPSFLIAPVRAKRERTSVRPMAPIHDAAGAHDVEGLRRLLAEGVSPDATDFSARTPLHCLCHKIGLHATPDLAACIKLLVDAGANLEAVNCDGFPPLLYSISYPKIVSLLLEAGANVNATTNDVTALHFACWDSDTVDCVELLLAAGADVDARDGGEETPLVWALKGAPRGAPRALPLLLRAGAEIPTNNTDPYIVRVRNAGGFKKYEQAHITRITSILAPTPRLPPEMVRKIVEFWLHAGYY